MRGPRLPQRRMCHRGQPRVGRYRRGLHKGTRDETEEVTPQDIADIRPRSPLGAPIIGRARGMAPWMALTPGDKEEVQCGS